ncbi:MAG: hypothetical protein M0P91_05895 [Sulfuricurvum sp.]|uniref:hypothetical protein n=1 Tax=Sulfuricurvum sp. TaxID=2025608 RepID=UPI0025DB9876|nr:hypothetical protein [Sulfuricurvum sp.]MCK9372711.1 hypothetical protein [Sulfuricurvum sp.]
MPTQPFMAYENETDSFLIGNLTVENRLDRISLYGSLDLPKTATGLNRRYNSNALSMPRLMPLNGIETYPIK